jgi:glycosyltransferase involved in cell wall biosynthesis
MLSTSDNEGMPIALIEAQLAGLPVVATNVGSSAEVVAHGESGVITSKDPVEIAQRVRELAHDADLRGKYGEFAKRRARQYFDPSTMCLTHREIYFRMGVK